MATSPRALRDAADKLAKILSSDEADEAQDSTIKSRYSLGQVITLRSQTEKGTQQLYSGLQMDGSENDAIPTMNARRLPNGFDLTDPAMMDTGILAPTKDRRLFGDVFRPNRTLKQLEVPRSSRTTFRGTTLGFSKETSLDKAAPLNRNDYKYQQLPVSSWLNYNMNDVQSSKKLRGKSFAQGDLRAALMANDVAAQEKEDGSALFRKAFSSFAPTTDTSKAVVSEQDRDRQWWSKYGTRKLRSIFKTPDIDPSSPRDELQEVDDDDFAGVVTDFQPLEAEDSYLNRDDPESVDEVLSEVSELLETVHSYQRIRSLDTRATAGASKPSSAELDSYEMLRSQLTILIDALPPFAVARLDGDKLEDLNISSNIVVDTVDYRGTAQPDEYTLSRYRAAPGVPATAPRPQAPPAQARPTYQTPNVPRYGTNNSLHAYAQNLGVAAARYGQGSNYNTPPTVQRSYQTPLQQPANTYNSQPTVQQFQRPAANGYPNYNATATPQAGQVQSPSQPGYQQQAQNKMAYNMNTPVAVGRSISPQGKGLVNGQTPGQHYPQQQQTSAAAGFQRPSSQQGGAMVNGQRSGA